jgi:transcriptional regulator with AAA-type ATPase domain
VGATDLKASRGDPSVGAGPVAQAVTTRAFDHVLLLNDYPRVDLLEQPLGDGFDLRALRARVTEHYLQRALEEAGGNKTKAAKLVGLANYQTFTNWLNADKAKE